MQTRDIVVIGTSAGGVEALLELLPALPHAFPAAVFVVLHLPPGGQDRLASILARRCALEVSTARDGETIEHGHVYVAPSDRHLLLARDRMVLSLGPTHNRHRPAIDPLFRSAARAFGPRVVGVVLTGFLDDGSEGLASIRNAGGYTIVQDPADALVPAMPRNALQRIVPDECAPLSEIPKLLEIACLQPIAEEAMPLEENGASQSHPTTITCPECHGVINEVHSKSGIRFECQIGHSFTPEGMFSAQADALEQALWAGVRSLEESASISRRLAQMSDDKNRPKVAGMYRTNATRREEHARTLRDLLERIQRHAEDPEIYRESA